MSINPNKDIATFNDYVEIIGVPKDQVNNELVANRIKRWILQATDQIDSMISGTGEIGKLYDWYDTLKDDNIIDQRKKYKIKKAICSWVECMVITGKFWVNGIPDMNANINIDINSSSQDGFIENIRKDIIQDLVVLGLYNTTNFNMEASYNANKANEVCDNGFVVIPKEALNDTYLKLEPQKALQGTLDMGANDIVNGGNILGFPTGAKPTIRQYEITECDIDLSKNNVKGSVPSADKATKADYILDPVDMIYKQINQFGVEYFGGFTKEQTIYIANRIFEASGIEWKPDIKYIQGQQTFKLTTTKQRNRPIGTAVFYYSLINDNLGLDPETHPEAWLEIANKDVPVGEIVEQLKPFIQQELNTMVPAEVEKQIKEKEENFNVVGVGEILDFGRKNQEENFEKFKQTFNVDDSYFEDVEEILFNEGEIKTFKTKDLATTFINDNNLIEDVDYQKIENGEILGQGDNYNLVGNNNLSLSYTLKRSDLPNINLAHTHDYYFGGGSGYLPGMRDGYNNTKGEFVSRTASTPLYINGNVEQTPIQLATTITPQYRETYSIIFLKDLIYIKKRVIKPIKQSGIYQPEIGGNYTGQAPVNVDNETNTISLEQEFVDKVENFDETQFAKLNAKNEFSQQQIIGLYNQGCLNFLPKFTYAGKDYVSFKITKGTRNYIQFETNLTDEVSKINVVYGSLIIENLATPTAGNQATNKDYVDNAIANATPPNQIRWYAGQVLYFETKEQWDTLATKFNLQLNVDYKIGEIGRYIKIGETGETGGTGIITNDNIQKMYGEFGFAYYEEITSAYSKGICNSWTSGGSRRSGNLVNSSRTGMGVGITIGIDSPTPIDVPFIERYEIIILRDI